jgi:hypothetical protein
MNTVTVTVTVPIGIHEHCDCDRDRDHRDDKHCDQSTKDPAVANTSLRVLIFNKLCTARDVRISYDACITVCITVIESADIQSRLGIHKLATP